MRYCEKCGYVMDEFDDYREEQNCPVCSGEWSEDDMTAIRYAELSEAKKDDYDEQLLILIKSSPKFDESKHRNCSTNDGQWWGGFRIDKYIKYESDERIVKSLLERRKANEPFKPFPPIDNVKAREVAEDAERTHRLIESGFFSKNSAEQTNIPKCPTCQSTNLRKISTTSKVVNTMAFGIFGTKRHRTFHCNNCGYEW